jgi:hypothetical protein
MGKTAFQTVLKNGMRKKTLPLSTSTTSSSSSSSSSVSYTLFDGEEEGRFKQFNMPDSDEFIIQKIRNIDNDSVIILDNSPHDNDAEVIIGSRELISPLDRLVIIFIC